MKFTPIVLAIAALLSGCASLDGNLDNRVTCTAARDKAYLVSEWWRFGISARVADIDAREICKAK
jgi:hypothetical protein